MVANLSEKEVFAIRTFDGKLTHKNPVCKECDRQCYSLYSGGRKDRLEDTFVCKKCNIIYKLPSPPKCLFSEVIA